MGELLNLVRIVQPEAKGNGIVPAQGARVILEDGSELDGVTKIVLTAEVNGIWKAEIHCHLGAIDLSAIAVVHSPGLWSRFKRWLSDVPGKGVW